MKLIIKGNKLRCIYSDDLMNNLASLGKVAIRRASHVEPIEIDGQIWWQADLSPVGGPKLPAKRYRKDALKAEVTWLKENGIPEPKETA